MATREGESDEKTRNDAGKSGASRREPPVIEGQASEVEGFGADAARAAEAAPEDVEAAAAATADAPVRKRKRGRGLLAGVALIVIAATGVAGYAAFAPQFGLPPLPPIPQPEMPKEVVALWDSALTTAGLKSEAPKPASSMSLGAKPAPKAEPAKPDTAKFGALKPDAAKPGTAKPAAPEASGSDAPKPVAEAPRAAAPVDAPKPAAPAAAPAEAAAPADAKPADSASPPAPVVAQKPNDAAPEKTAPLEQPSSASVAIAANAAHAKIDAISARLDALQGRVDAIPRPIDPTARLDALAQRLAALEARLDQPKTDARAHESRENAGAGPDSNAARAVVAQSLTQALGAGAPLETQIAALRNLGVGDDKLGALAPFAKAGAPAAAALATQWASLRSKIVATDAPNVSGGDWMEKLSAKAQSLVRVEKIGAQSGASAGAVYSRVEDALKRGDLGEALKASDALPDAAKGIAADWRKAAQQRVAAEAAARAVLADAVAALGRPKS